MLRRYEIANQVSFWIALLLSVALLSIVICFVRFVSTEYPVTIELASLSKQPPGESIGVQYESIRVKYLEQYIEIFSIIVVGVLAALVSVLIPLVYSRAKAKFERYKEARSAYSKAKTAVLYLADRVLGATIRGKGAESHEKPFDLIEKAHRELHLAETFDVDIRNQGFLDWYDDPKVWVLHNYWRVIAVAAALRWYEEPEKPEQTGQFGDPENSREREKKKQPPPDFREKLKQTSSIVDDAFGELGNKWKTYNAKVAQEQAKAKLEIWYLPSRKRRVREHRREKEKHLRYEIETSTIPGAAIGLRRDSMG